MATKVIRYLSNPRDVWKQLNGIFVVFKPAGTHALRVRKTILSCLCNELGSMEPPPPTQHVSIVGDTTNKLDVIVKPNYADHPLIAGPYYQEIDFKLVTANILWKDYSGVLVFGINKGTNLAFKIRQASLTRFYKVKGILGQATDNYFKSGKIVEKSTYKHVKRSIIDKICSSMQASHQRKMFELSGIDMQSQTAYELALQGPTRPGIPHIPMIYTIKCTDFTPPEFTLEIVCINEDDMYLKTIIHEIGMKLHTTATCTQLLCFQYGLFHINSTLLSRCWDLESIISNIQYCQELIDKNPFLIKQNNSALVESNSNNQEFV